MIYLEAKALDAHATTPRGRLAIMRIHAADGELTEEDFVGASEIALGGPLADAETQLEALRILQLALGDVELDSTGVMPGYSAGDIDRIDPRTRTRVGKRLADGFPAEDPRVNQELARLLAMLSISASPEFAERFSREIVESQPLGKSPRDVGLALHYLMSLSHFEFPETPVSQIEVIAGVLIELHHSLRAKGQYVSRNWPLRVGETYERLSDRFSVSSLDESVPLEEGSNHRRPREAVTLDEGVSGHAGFGLPEHSVFVLHMKPRQQQIAARG